MTPAQRGTEVPWGAATVVGAGCAGAAVTAAGAAVDGGTVGGGVVGGTPVGAPQSEPRNEFGG